MEKVKLTVMAKVTGEIRPKPRAKKRNYNDPIFDNHFNKGEIDCVPFETKVEIDKQYATSRLDECYNSHDYYRNGVLNKAITEIYKGSKWDLAYTIKKKIPKCELSELFQFIREALVDETYSEIEIFVEIADYLDIKYKNLFDMVSNGQKRKLLGELNEEFSMIRKLKTQKLF